MIVEYIRYGVAEERRAAFEAAYDQAQAALRDDVDSRPPSRPGNPCRGTALRVASAQVSA